MKLLVIIFSLISITVYGQAQSDEVLYYNCAKTISFDPKEFKDLSFSVEGAEKITIPPSIRIVPYDSIVEVIVYKKGKLYKTYNYNATPIPAPNIEVWIGEKNKNSTGIYWVLGIKTINNRLRDNFPSDARYRIDEYEIKIERNGKIIEQRLIFDSIRDIVLAGLKKDDVISIEVKKVTRTNFRNEKEEVKINSKVRTINVDDELNLPIR